MNNKLSKALATALFTGMMATSVAFAEDAAPAAHEGTEQGEHHQAAHNKGEHHKGKNQKGKKAAEKQKENACSGPNGCGGKKMEKEGAEHHE